MSSTIQDPDVHAGLHQDFQARTAAAAPGWLRDLRAEAISRFSALGFPTTEHEDWRFTNVEGIASRPFTLAGAAPGRCAPGDLAPLRFDGLDAAALVVVDGCYRPELSDVSGLPQGVEVLPLSEAIVRRGALVQAHLARYADFQEDAFTALNTAFSEHGFFCHIPRGTVVQRPIHLLFVSTAAAAGTVDHPRNLIVAEENTQAAVIEDYAALGGGEYLTNAVTELVLGEGAVFNHYLLERESPQSFNVSTLRIEQHRSSNLSSHSVLMGGALVRNNVHPVLAGEGCESLLNGLYLVDGRRHVDNFMMVEHARPHCNSRQFYKGVLDGSARAVFSGRIIVHPDAQKTDAKQSNMNLLLSDHAQIDTKPQLEIYADDVKCTHGATIGQIDADAVFYLRSRGVSAAAARSLLIYAFANESLERMGCTALRQGLERQLLDRLPQGPGLEIIG